MVSMFSACLLGTISASSNPNDSVRPDLMRALSPVPRFVYTMLQSSKRLFVTCPEQFPGKEGNMCRCLLWELAREECAMKGEQELDEKRWHDERVGPM
ncbi:hypothetical protein NDU88_002375 [Pleurodeles waltl]|uniref:Uncharacterized protein n=1 Tax=Pleurodeles waltl TaxID=8319 RepID=A0AAV7UVI4_PLEWA|nr:hypothetical protein NDU88_002375 [Pleurodeles waltl]